MSHMSKPNVTRVQIATQWTASVHMSHMSKPNVTRVQIATQWTASVHMSHMSKPNVTRVQIATQWTASVHMSRMSKPNVTSHGRTLTLSEKCVGPKKSSAATGDVTLFLLVFFSMRLLLFFVFLLERLSSPVVV